MRPIGAKPETLLAFDVLFGGPIAQAPLSFGEALGDGTIPSPLALPSVTMETAVEALRPLPRVTGPIGVMPEIVLAMPVTLLAFDVLRAFAPPRAFFEWCLFIFPLPGAPALCQLALPLRESSCLLTVSCYPSTFTVTSQFEIRNFKSMRSCDLP
jgi:hypothetical protein